MDRVDRKCTLRDAERALDKLSRAEVCILLGMMIATSEAVPSVPDQAQGLSPFFEALQRDLLRCIVGRRPLDED